MSSKISKEDSNTVSKISKEDSNTVSKIKNIIKAKDINQLKDIVKKIGLGNVNFNILNYAIEEDSPIDIIKWLIDEIQQEEIKNYENNLKKLSEKDLEFYKKMEKFNQSKKKFLAIPLVYAIKNNNLKIAELLVKEYTMDINFTDDTGNSPLMYSVKINSLPIIELLMNQGASLIYFDKTILGTAIESGEIDIINYFIEKGVDVNYIDKNKNTPLIYALQKKSFDIVKLLMENNADCNYKKDGNIQSVIFEKAIETGNKQIVEYLIEKKVPYKLNEKYGIDILEKAYKSSNAKYKFQNKILYNLEDEDNNTIILSQVNKGYLNEYIKKHNLYNKSIKVTEFSEPMVIKSVNDRIIRSYYLNKEEDLKDLSENNISYDQNFINYVISLIKKNNKSSILSLILKYKPYLLRYILQDQKIDINEKYDNEEYPLITAIMNDDIDSVIFLTLYGYSKKTNMNILSSKGVTPLILAYNLNNKNKKLIIDELIKYVDISQRDSKGNNILYYILDDIYLNYFDYDQRYEEFEKKIENNDFDEYDDEYYESDDSCMDIDDNELKECNNEEKDDNYNDNLYKKLVYDDIDVFYKDNTGIYFLTSIYKKSKYLYAYTLKINNTPLNKLEESPIVNIINDITGTFTISDKKNIIKSYIDRGCNVNFVDQKGFTPLVYAINMKATVEEKLSIIKLLIDNEADINFTIKDNGQTILEYSKKEEEIYNYLKINVKD